MKRRSNSDPSPRPVKKRILRLKRRRISVLPPELCPPTDAPESPPLSPHPTNKIWRLRSLSAPAKLFSKPINENNPVVHLDTTKSDINFTDPWPSEMLTFKGQAAELERPPVRKMQVTELPDDLVITVVAVLSMLIPHAYVVRFHHGNHDLLTSCWKFLKCYAITVVILAWVAQCYCAWIGRPIFPAGPVLPGVGSEAVVDKTADVAEGIEQADEAKRMEKKSDPTEKTEEDNGGLLDKMEGYHYVTDLHLSVPGSWPTA